MIYAAVMSLSRRSPARIADRRKSRRAFFSGLPNGDHSSSRRRPMMLDRAESVTAGAADLARVRGIAFTAGQPQGAFRFGIDDVEVK
ncbi:hypothetical protein GCM10023307_10000 [Lysobacter hankyongensis]|uniref:Uncharacterized protein n=1 Tax=Lysobacter hankyongensis TaxID=1176535 RepID=A0ABP9AXB5_9GAMM